MIELLPTLIATNATALTPDAGGEAQPIEVDFGQGDGARIIYIEWLLSGPNTTVDVATGLSTDPNDTAPANLRAISLSTNVIQANNIEINITTEGGYAHWSLMRDMSAGLYIITRDLSALGYTAGSGVTIECRVHYNQVRFSESELRAITITNR